MISSALSKFYCLKYLIYLLGQNYTDLEEVNISGGINHPTKFKPPKSSLLRQSISMLNKLVFWKKISLLLFSCSMVFFPLMINYINVKMIQGSNNLSLYFCNIYLLNVFIDFIREIFLIKVGVDCAIIFIRNEIKRYSELSKPTTYKYPASKTLEKDLSSAANSIIRFIEWGTQSIFYTLGTIVSCSTIIFTQSAGIQDILFVFVIIFGFILVLRPIQAKMTKTMEKHREITNRSNDLLSYRSVELQNKECSAIEYSHTLGDPVDFDRNVMTLFTYTHRFIDLMIAAVMYINAFYSPDDRHFAIKYVLINSMANAINSISSFGNQYSRYCNDYEKYYRMFRDSSLKYEEKIPQQDIPELFTLSQIHVPRGSHIVTSTNPLVISQGKQYLIKGPSGAGKSTFLDAIKGFIPGILVQSGVLIGAYCDKIVVHLQNAQSTSLTNVSIYDIFRSTDSDKIRKFLELLFDRNKLKTILDNISEHKEDADPFSKFIENKMSGGEKTRFFLAHTLFKAIENGAKIVFLDEPEQGQDPDLQIETFKVISQFARDNNLTVFWITHLRSEALTETEITFDGGTLNFSLDGRITIN